MRKGRLIIENVGDAEVGSTYFDLDAKICVTVEKVMEAGLVEGVNARFGGPVKIHANSDRLCVLTVEDLITDEVFDLNIIQQPYVYKAGETMDFKFYTRDVEGGVNEEAFILAKNVEMSAHVKMMSTIVDSYGQYVSGQKSINEPAKNFEDWFFDVSI